MKKNKKHLKCVKSKFYLFKQSIVKENVLDINWMHANQVYFIWPDYSALNATFELM